MSVYFYLRPDVGGVGGDSRCVDVGTMFVHSKYVNEGERFVVGG